MNYFEVHLNKRPKKIPQRRLNYKKAHITLITTIGAIQVRTIQSNPFIDITDKKQRISSCVLDTAKVIQNIFSPKQKYLERIKKTKP